MVIVRRPAVVSLAAAALLVPAALAATHVCAAASFVNFESQHIHPIALSADGAALFVVNTPDNRLSVFDLTGPGAPALHFEVEVGLEPVTVRQQGAARVWVVNHLSDSISIVDLTTRNVVATVQTGDEPTDVVFTPDPSSPGEQWAWVCVSEEDRIQIFDAETPASELQSIAIPGSDPRALAYDSGRQRVYAAVFESGNRTSIVPRHIRADPGGPWGGQLPPFDPPLQPGLPPVPDNGVIVRWLHGDWVDEQGGVWTDLVPWTVTDVDVARIDLAPIPMVTQAFEGVGTLLFDIAVHEPTGDVFVTNTEALNDVLFEPKLKGQFARNRMTRIPGGDGVPEVHHLNPHIDYDVPEGNPSERALSVSQPAQMAIRPDGQAIYFTAIGARVIGIAGPTGGRADELPYREGGTGIVLDAGRALLYVVNRFDNMLDAVDPASGNLVHAVPIGRSGFDPTPALIRGGRKFLYAGRFSAHGDLACATCHPFAGFDNLSWDLGDPTGAVQPAPPPEQNGGIEVNDFHPVKGPMTTQTLRGLFDTGRLHWRGDKDDFSGFNGAFRSLLGGPDLLNPANMMNYSDFIMTVTYPPNPFVQLDNTLVSSPPDSNALQGSVIFQLTNELDCDGCHTLPTGTSGLIIPLDEIPGFGGQVMKIAQLRNMYEKTGFESTAGPNPRGFGYLHDGGVHSLREFVEEPVLRLDPGERPHVIAFLLSFPTGTAAAVGHQVTVQGTGGIPGLPADLTVLEGQAALGNIDLIAKGVVGGEHRGYRFAAVSGGGYQPDRESEPLLDLEQLVAQLAPGEALTFTGTPPLCGQRLGIDRDLDGALDRDELDAGTDPANPLDFPGAIGVREPLAAAPPRTAIVSVAPNPFNPLATIRFTLAERSQAGVFVYGVGGRLVKRLAGGVLEPGEHAARWDGRNDSGQPVASGTYFLILRTREHAEAWKVTLAR